MDTPAQEPAPLAGRRLRAALIAAAILLLLPVGGVLAHGLFPVPVTLLMVQRSLEGEALDYRWRPLREISPRLIEAVIAAEDANFCSHMGFDFEAIEQAMAANARGRRLRGASTLSQQTAKNVYLWPGRGWLRKGLEAGYTGLIEAVWTKGRVMEVYLNVAEWGPGVYGAEAAARHWFGKSASDLSASEAARLAAILPSPRRYQAASPGPYVRRRAAQIQGAMATVREQGLGACIRR